MWSSSKVPNYLILPRSIYVKCNLKDVLNVTLVLDSNQIIKNYGIIILSICQIRKITKPIPLQKPMYWLEIIVLFKIKLVKYSFCK